MHRLCVYELERRARRTGFVREWYRWWRVGAEPVLSFESERDRVHALQREVMVVVVVVMAEVSGNGRWR